MNKRQRKAEIKLLERVAKQKERKAADIRRTANALRKKLQGEEG